MVAAGVADPKAEKPIAVRQVGAADWANRRRGRIGDWKHLTLPADQAQAAESGNPLHGTIPPDQPCYRYYAAFASDFAWGWRDVHGGLKQTPGRRFRVDYTDNGPNGGVPRARAKSRKA